MSNQQTGDRASFSGKLGYVLATAGSAVGLGNIWRFPYLAAKYGGGIFLLVYLILVVTFGYTLIVSETALGRKTAKSPIGAFRAIGKSKGYLFGGWMNAVIPMIITPYYCVIGGWVLRYLAGYIAGGVQLMAGDNYFSDFISNGVSVEGWFVVFAACTVAVIAFGVQKGVERVSKIMMPALVILAIIVAIYSMTRPGAVEGIKYFLIPDFSRFSWMTVVTAMGQMFYSLSCAMGILYTYGSYMKKEVSIEKSTEEVELFDTAIAILAGLMIIPAVFAFSGSDAAENLQAGPSLMFITMPKIFGSMGLGTAIGIAFFLLVFFAALTSAVSLAETCASTFEDELHLNRKGATAVVAVIIFGLGTLSSLGFNVLSNVTILGMDFLDFFDFLSNSLMMPIAAIATCILVLRKATLDGIADEVMLGGAKFRRRKVYNFVIKYLAIAFLAIIFLSSVLNVLGVISM
ncbi:MAG: sodium-dependent transporter [Eubacteriales bacterium]|jgi:NSS family neurotransmitter:Na+ symporter